MRGERTALLVVDMLNPYEHDDADRLAESVRTAVAPIAGLIERALAGRHPDLVEPLLARDDDSFVIKARHSVFYSTPDGSFRVTPEYLVTIGRVPA